MTIHIQPMPPWRERQILRLMADAPEPVWWGAVLRPSAWVLAFLAVVLAAWEWGYLSGFQAGLSVAGLR